MRATNVRFLAPAEVRAAPLQPGGRKLLTEVLIGLGIAAGGAALAGGSMWAQGQLDDVIYSIAERRQALQEERNELQQEYERQLAQIEQELAELDAAEREANAIPVEDGGGDGGWF